MGSDWWAFNEDVERWAKKKLDQFQGTPTKLYLSENWYAAEKVVKDRFPNIEIIWIPSTYDDNDMRLE
jgi:hypothetical protein